MSSTKEFIQVYTDGAYSHSQDRGGFGAVIFVHRKGKNISKSYASEVAYSNTTSPRMEIRAILASLRVINVGSNVDLYSDSSYCVKTLNKLLSNRKSHINANRELWLEVLGLLKKHTKGGSKFQFSWVRAHAGNPYNEMADQLANNGKMKDKVVDCKKQKESR